MGQLHPGKKLSSSGHADTLRGVELMVSIYNSASGNECPKSPFRSTDFGILMVKKGSLKIKINFVAHILNARDILCMLPDHIYEIPEEPDATVIFTHFNKSYLARKGIFFNIAETYKIFNGNELLKFSLSKAEYEQVLADMMALQNRLSISKHTRHIDDIIHNSFLSIVYDIFLLNEKQKKLPEAAINSKVELTNRFLSLVSERFKAEKRVIYYANCLHITPRHLSQVVKQVTGRSAGEHIDDFVIREAKLLLTGHVMNISEIAEELHFSNPSFFGKYFKKHAGLSPLSFKRDHNIAL
ncbi:AraC family transcriptional regulator [Pedobacter soli]|uniref:AraC-type DNA-binding protein n=1 Tax=Pedobacter soli TaxID=390242 RepID=A0A1G7B8M5_9SPHI|nr:helix-turn-helix domain-containing protein [Pedobacter soli]SDE23391.1 AraC-type DNA-binding protein [Pedobacter soli]